MSAYYYSLGMLLKYSVGTEITPESVRVLLLRNLLADEDNQ